MAAGFLDPEQDLTGGSLPSAERAALGAGLHDHGGHAVRHDVVELVRDSRPLVGDRAACLLLALAFQRDGAVGEADRARAVRAYCAARSPHARLEEGDEESVAWLAVDDALEDKCGDKDDGSADERSA